MQTLVESSLLSSIEYWSDQTRDLTFRSGATCRYFAVPQTVAEEVIAAESKGAYFCCSSWNVTDEVIAQYLRSSSTRKTRSFGWRARRASSYGLAGSLASPGAAVAASTSRTFRMTTAIWGTSSCCPRLAVGTPATLSATSIPSMTCPKTA